MKQIISFLFALSLFIGATAEKIPDVTGLILTDCEGNSWNIDELLNDYKVLWIHQMFKG
jgi:hypothetical protein